MNETACDEALMAEVVEGKHEALETLIRRHATPLLSFLHSKTGDYHHGEVQSNSSIVANRGRGCRAGCRLQRGRVGAGVGVCKTRKRNATHSRAVLAAGVVCRRARVCKTRKRNAIHFCAVLAGVGAIGVCGKTPSGLGFAV